MNLLLALTVTIFAASTALAQPAQPDGEALYLEYCASCHGANLEGQPNWMERLPSGRLPAPPHDETGHSWHHSDEQLLRIVRDGLAAIAPGYQTDMPAFRGTLSDQEIVEILDYIKQTWPDREREVQRSR
ncbi:MAG: cytochrome c [Kaiparowitsia implicata GSE-PSE-MK54-09C]|jgi:mono/diheme cytochrome c family protein|nr:cytochrome c [Kaiparowitsia implicata GSE-PSE-MK54-09C]